MNETPFFFPNGSYRLFGVLHEGKEPNRKTGFVFCNPFAEEKLWGQRVLVNFARELAERGNPVLRFDYMGTGDSEGDFEECSIETKLSDIRCAVRTLQEKAPGIESIGLLGLRFGATLAALAACTEKGVERLVLWEPIISGAAYMREMLRINVATQGAVYKEIRYNSEALIRMMKEGKTVNVDGYEMAWPLYSQSVEIDLPEIEMSCEAETLVVQISQEGKGMNPSFERIRPLFKDCSLRVSVEDTFWKEIPRFYSKANSLYQLTLDWLEGR